MTVMRLTPVQTDKRYLTVAIHANKTLKGSGVGAISKACRYSRSASL
jgi:hypothetical protein